MRLFSFVSFNVCHVCIFIFAFSFRFLIQALLLVLFFNSIENPIQTFYPVRYKRF